MQKPKAKITTAITAVTTILPVKKAATRALAVTTRLLLAGVCCAFLLSGALVPVARSLALAQTLVPLQSQPYKVDRADRADRLPHSQYSQYSEYSPPYQGIVGTPTAALATPPPQPETPVPAPPTRTPVPPPPAPTNTSPPPPPTRTPVPPPTRTPVPPPPPPTNTSPPPPPPATYTSVPPPARTPVPPPSSPQPTQPPQPPATYTSAPKPPGPGPAPTNTYAPQPQPTTQPKQPTAVGHSPTVPTVPTVPTGATAPTSVPAPTHPSVVPSTLTTPTRFARTALTPSGTEGGMPVIYAGAGDGSWPDMLEPNDGPDDILGPVAITPGVLYRNLNLAPRSQPTPNPRKGEDRDWYVWQAREGKCYQAFTSDVKGGSVHALNLWLDPSGRGRTLIASYNPTKDRPEEGYATSIRMCFKQNALVAAEVYNYPVALLKPAGSTYSFAVREYVSPPSSVSTGTSTPAPTNTPPPPPTSTRPPVPTRTSVSVPVPVAPTQGSTGSGSGGGRGGSGGGGGGGSSAPVPQLPSTGQAQTALSPTPTPVPAATVTPLPEASALSTSSETATPDLIVPTATGVSATATPVLRGRVDVVVHLDLNHDGEPDPGEGIQGVRVLLIDMRSNRIQQEQYTDGYGSASLQWDWTGPVRVSIPEATFGGTIQSGEMSSAVRGDRDIWSAGSSGGLYLKVTVKPHSLPAVIP